MTGSARAHGFVGPLFPKQALLDCSSLYLPMVPLRNSPWPASKSLRRPARNKGLKIVSMQRNNPTSINTSPRFNPRYSGPSAQEQPCPIAQSCDQIVLFEFRHWPTDGIVRLCVRSQTADDSKQYTAAQAARTALARASRDARASSASVRSAEDGPG